MQTIHCVRTELIFDTYSSVATIPLKIIRLNSQKSATTDRDLCGEQVLNQEARLLQKCCKNSSDWLSSVLEITHVMISERLNKIRLDQQQGNYGNTEAKGTAPMSDADWDMTAWN